MSKVGFFDLESAKTHAQARARYTASERVAARAARRVKAEFPPAQGSDPAMDRAVGLISLQGGAGRSHEVSVGGYRLLLKAKLVHSGLTAGGGLVEGRAVQITAYYQGPDEGGVGDGESCETCINGIFQDFLHLVVGASDGRDCPDQRPHSSPGGRGSFLSRLEGSLLGDLIGGLALAVTLVGWLYLAWGLS